MKTSLACPRKAPLALNSPELTHLSGERHSLLVPASPSPLARRGSPAAQGPQRHLGLGPDLSIQVLSYQHKALPVSPPPPNSSDFRATTVTFRWSHSRQEDGELFAMKSPYLPGTSHSTWLSIHPTPLEERQRGWGNHSSSKALGLQQCQQIWVFAGIFFQIFHQRHKWKS